MNLRERILSINDIKSEIVQVDEWGVEIMVRGLSGAQRARLMQSAMDDKGRMDIAKMYPDLVILAAYDPETGEQVFERADRDALNEKASGALEKIAQAAMRLSGIGPNALKEAEKNS